MASTAAESSTESSIEILVLSWNVGNKQPNGSEVEAWLPADGGGYDLIAVGTQENDFKEKTVDEDADGWQKRRGSSYDDNDDDDLEAEADPLPESRELTKKHRLERLAAVRAASASKSESAWDAMVADRLGAGYKVVKHEVMREMRLTLYAKKEHLLGPSARISGVQAAQSATGIGGVIANKGGILIKLAYGTTTLAFCSCHLAAHAHKLKRRNADCLEILDETTSALDYPQVDGAHQFDHFFWLGDLNYRVDLNLVSPTPAEEHFAKVQALVDRGDYPALMAADQLRWCQERGEAFVGFVEGEYAFAPTFKVERTEGSRYKTKRIPSYCDRILWKSMPPLRERVHQSLLCSAPSVTTSDHKPVYSSFRITPTPAVSHVANGVPPPLVQVLSASVDGVSDTDKTYLVFMTNPAGLLCSLDQRPPRTRAVPSGKSTATPSRLAASWSAEQCPLLRPSVADPLDLARVTLIVAVYDADVLSKDDLLGAVLIPLAHPDGAAVMGSGGVEEYELTVRQPIVKGTVSADKGTLEMKLKVSYGAKLMAALETAVGNEASSAPSTGGCCLLQ